MFYWDVTGINLGISWGLEELSGKLLNAVEHLVDVYKRLRGK
jgi:hypothetical protein